MTFFRWILLPPLVVLAMLLAVANRQTITFSLDPFNPAKPALGIDMPLALIVFVAMLIGILIGGMAAWGQAKRRHVTRNYPVPPSKAFPIAEKPSEFGQLPPPNP